MNRHEPEENMMTDSRYYGLGYTFGAQAASRGDYRNPDTDVRITANETNGLLDPIAYHDAFPADAITVPWTTPGLRITRLRLLTEPGFPWCDVSYVHGMLNGEHVRVDVPFFHLPRKGLNRAIVEYASKDGVHAKSLGVFDAISILF